MVMLTDLASGTAPTSTSTTTAATPNSLTNAYNKLNSIIPTVVNAAGYATSSSDTSAPTVLAMKNAISGISGATVVNAAGYGASTSDTAAPTVLAVQNAISAISSGTTSTATNFGTSAASTVTLGTAARTTNVAGTIILGSDQTGAYQVSLNSGTMNLMCSTGTFGGTINIGNATNVGVPSINLGAFSTTGNSSINMGIGSGSGLTTINIANGTNSGGNVVNIGNATSTLTLKGSVYNPIVSATTSTAGIVQLIDSLSTSTALAPTANSLNSVATIANAANTLANTANTTANAANATANAALPSASLASSTNFGSGASAAVSVGVSGQTLNLQGVPNPIAFQLAFSDEVTAITTANQVNIRAPFAFNIRSSSLPLFMLLNLGSSGVTTFDIMKNGVSIYSVKPYIGYNAAPTNAQYTSQSGSGVLATNPTVISQFDLIRVYVYTASGAGMLGAKVIVTAT